jgi:CheY-like chemotaxis protein
MTTTTDPVRVLVVDDSEDQLLLLRRYFERAHCTVEVAATALDAIASYESFMPDLTVIDLVLPGMDGWELAAQLSAENPDCAIAITSVLSTEHYPPEYIAMPKPVTAQDARNALAALVPRWSNE